MHKYSSPTHRSHLWYLPKHQGVLHSITTSVVICTIIWKGAATSKPRESVHYSDDCWLCWCSEVQGTDGSQQSQMHAPFHPWQAQQALILGGKGQRLSLGKGKAPWHAGHLNSILPGSQGPCPAQWSRSIPQWGGFRQEEDCLMDWVFSNAEIPNAFSISVCRNRWLGQSGGPNLASPGCWRVSWCHMGVEGTRADLHWKGYNSNQFSRDQIQPEMGWAPNCHQVETRGADNSLCC